MKPRSPEVIQAEREQNSTIWVDSKTRTVHRLWGADNPVPLLEQFIRPGTTPCGLRLEVRNKTRGKIYTRAHPKMPRCKECWQ